MTNIGLWFLEKVIAVVPGLLLKRVFPPEKVATHIRVELVGERPIAPSLTSSVPHLDLNLSVTNLSPLQLRLDRMLVDLWFGQPVLNGALLERMVVPPRSTENLMYFRGQLSSAQVRQVEPYTQTNPPSAPISLTVRAYFDTRVGPVEYERRFERRSAH